ncbi:MAG: ParA family protein [Chitinophagaceae bacterium]|nr:ParA family protein [Chitinophagaceae bacterium]
MPIISILIPKGGTGKTMTAVNLAAALCKRGCKVLLVDMDPQANMSQALGLEDKDGEHFLNELEKVRNEMPANIANAIVTTACGLAIVPASRALSRTDYELVGTYKGSEVLKRLLEPVQYKYDFVFIDCPSAWNQLTQNAAVASDFVLMPMQAEMLPEKGLDSFYYNLEDFRKENDTIPVRADILGIIFTKFDEKKKINRAIAKKLSDEYGGKVFNTRIRWSAQLVNAQVAGLDIFSFNPKSNGAKDYDSLAAEFLGRFQHR